MAYSILKVGAKELVPRVRVARSFFTRFLGLMGRKSIPANEALLFPRCNSIHTFFMRFPIDVVFLSKDGTVVGVVESMRPWRLLLPKPGAKHTLELAGGRSKELGIAVGQRVECEGVLS